MAPRAPALQVRAANRGLARLEVAYPRPDGERLDLGISVSPLATGRTYGGWVTCWSSRT